MPALKLSVSQSKTDGTECLEAYLPDSNSLSIGYESKACRRWRSRRNRNNPGIHVSLDLRGTERPIVNPNLIDQSRPIRANSQRLCGSGNHPRLSLTGHLHTVYIQSQSRAVVCPRQMRPRVHRQYLWVLKHCWCSPRRPPKAPHWTAKNLAEHNQPWPRW